MELDFSVFEPLKGVTPLRLLSVHVENIRFLQNKLSYLFVWKNA